MAEIIPLLPDSVSTGVGMIVSFLSSENPLVVFYTGTTICRSYRIFCFLTICLTIIFRDNIIWNNMITVTLNDKDYQLEENTTLAVFIESLDIKPQGIAIAIDYTVVPKEQWGKTLLADKTNIMLIHAVSGG